MSLQGRGSDLSIEAVDLIDAASEAKDQKRTDREENSLSRFSACRAMCFAKSLSHIYRPITMKGEIIL
jgi:hypothetical protein